MPTKLTAKITGLFAGNAKEHWPDKPASAIDKSAVRNQQEISTCGLISDEQADRSVHGGPDKALHHYPGEHYATWKSEGILPRGSEPCAFGENISSFGLTEDNLCIGDVFQLGTATVQISQGRQPCWKLNEHTGNSQMAYLFQKTGRTGWYYRVLETGWIQSGDPINLIDRPNPQWSIKRVTRARLTRKVTPDDARKLADLEELAQGWRQAFAKMAKGDTKEDTSARLAL